MLTNLKSGLKCLLQGALMALATVAYAADDVQFTDEVRLDTTQLRTLSAKGSLLDSSTSILNFKAKPVDGVSLSPELKLIDRLQLAAKQLAADTSYAAQVRADAAKGVTPPVDNLNANKIIGSDNRQKISDTRATPWKAICYIEMTFPKGTASGTAEFVHPRVLLSASHCVYDSSLGGWAKYIRVVPGKNGTSEPYGSQYCARIAVPPEWTSGQEGNRDFDMSWIIMPDRTLFNRVGFTFGYQTTTDATLKSTILNLSGYHGDKNGEQWFMGGGGNQTVYASQFRHTLDTMPGASGAPVWIYTSSNGLRRIAGVHVAGPSTTYNVATRMTSRYFGWTQNFNTQYP